MRLPAASSPRTPVAGAKASAGRGPGFRSSRSSSHSTRCRCPRAPPQPRGSPLRPQAASRRRSSPPRTPPTRFREAEVKGNDKTIFVIVGVVVLAGLFWMMAISPKREEASKLDKEAEDLRAQVSLQQQTAVFGEQARREFPEYYGRLVTLGKAVPEQADSASLMIQLNDIAGVNDVKFAGIALSQGTGGAGTSTTAATGAAPAAPAAPEAAPATGGDSAPASATPTESSAAPAPPGSADPAAAAVATPAAAATEATAAAQPIGAVIGPAGVSTLPYELT